MADSVQYKTILTCFPKLRAALNQGTITVANELLAEGLISPSTVDVEHNINAQKLATLLLEKVEVAPKRYYRIVELLSKHEWLADIVEALHKIHG